MTNEQILQKIANLEKALSDERVPEASKAKMRTAVEDLKKNLKEAEEKVEKQEEKIEKDETKERDKVESRIEQLKKAIADPRVPEKSKEKMREAIKKAEGEMAEQKKEVKEQKKEVEQEKKQVRKAVEKLEKVAKAKRTYTKRKGAKKKSVVKEALKKIKVKSKDIKKKSVRRKAKLKSIMFDLQKLINTNKRLKKEYKGAGVDLEKDSKRSAKPIGYRFKGEKDYRKPTPEQVKRGLKRGTVYKETRPERGDVFPKGYKGKIKLEDGGMMAQGGEMAKGGLFADSYNRGRSWKLDRARHNKKEDYEIPMNKRKRKRY